MANAFTPQQYAESYKNAFQSVDMPNPADYGNMTATPEMYAPTPSGTPWDVLAGMGSQMQYKRAAEEAMANKVAYDAAVKDATLNKESVEYGIKMSDKATEAANKPIGSTSEHIIYGRDGKAYSVVNGVPKAITLPTGEQIVSGNLDASTRAAVAEATAGGREFGMTTMQARAKLPVLKALTATLFSQLDGLLNHQGFKKSVGMLSKPVEYFPSGSPERDWRNRFDNIKAQAFTQAFETLKGGGQITEKEGEAATKAKNRMDSATSEREFIIATNEFRNALQQGLNNITLHAEGKWNVAPSASGGDIHSKAQGIINRGKR